MDRCCEALPPRSDGLNGDSVTTISYTKVTDEEGQVSTQVLANMKTISPMLPGKSGPSMRDSIDKMELDNNSKPVTKLKSIRWVD